MLGDVNVLGNICFMVLFNCLKPEFSVPETGDASLLKSFNFSFIRLSLIAVFTCETIAFKEVPGRIRKLTTAKASAGITFSLIPALKMVGAIVVFTKALPDGVF